MVSGIGMMVEMVRNSQILDDFEDPNQFCDAVNVGGERKKTQG